MTPRHILTTLLDRLGITLPSRPRSLAGTGAPVVLLLMLASLAVAAVVPVAALANGGHAFERAIGLGPGEGAGQLELAAPAFRAESITTQLGPTVTIAGSGVAVSDASHDVYVADTGNRRVDEFSSSGAFMRAWGEGVADGLSMAETCGPAAFPPTATCKKGLAGSEPGALEAPKFVAVDNSTEAADLSKGDVYVGTGVGKQAVDELQALEITGGAFNTVATGGTYTLTFKGETTAPIRFLNEATAASEYPEEPFGSGTRSSKRYPDAEAAQEALEALPAIGKGNVKVEERSFIEIVGQAENGTSFVGGFGIEFVGALGETTVSAVGCDPEKLTPQGAQCNVSVKREGAKFAGEIISKFSPEGKLDESWGVKGQLDGSGAEKGPFAGKLEGVAVGPSGGLLVGDEGDVFGFDEAGVSNKATLRLQGETSESASGLAVDGAGDLYAVAGRGEVEKYTSAGAPVEAVSAGHKVDPAGFAVDTATAGVYVGLGESLEQGSPVEVFGEPQLKGGAGVAVDSSQGEPPLSGSIYAANTVSDQLDVFSIALKAETSAASEVGVTSITLNGTVDPEGTPVGKCYFEYGPSTAFGQSAECEPDAAGIGSGTGEVAVHAKVKGLQAGTIYHYRLVAAKGATVIAGEAVATPATLPLPVVAGAEAPLTDLTASSAQLTATVDPEGLPVTSCEFEFGTSTSYGTVLPCKPTATRIGAGTEPVPVSAAIEGLQPNTTYHWRLSVKDGDGEAYAPDHTFVYPTSAAALPDDRAYEMVSPVQKNGASLGGTVGARYAFAEDGSDFMETSIQCFAGSQSCTASRGNTGEPFEFTRTPSGWVTTALAPPGSEFDENSRYLLSPGEGMALFSMPPTPNGPDNWYVRQAEGSFLDIGPLTPTGPTVFGDISYTAATSDFSHLVWVVLASGGDQWPGSPAHTEAVYEYAGAGNSHPLLVGVDDAGEPLDCDITLGGSFGAENQRTRNALSADGRTVYFTACEKGLYARIDGEEPDIEGVRRRPATVAVSAPECAAGQPGVSACKEAESHPGKAEFQGASSDGSRAFFTDSQQLMDSASTGNNNLYEFECANHCENQADRRLIDVSAGDTSGFGPQVRGVVTTSADGSHVYFVAGGVLASGASPGADNLYVYERDERDPEGHVTFVASLPATDHQNWDGTVNTSVNVTPEGRFIVFESRGNLTADDARDDGSTQIFRYDADPSAEEQAAHVPQLVRISAGDEGYNDDGNAGTGNAGIVAPFARGDAAGPQRGDPTMSNDGSYVFFYSPIALTPHALNDVVTSYEEIEFPLQSGEFISTNKPNYALNVYEYHEGHVYLISDGRDVSAGLGGCGHGSSVCLLGSDASGHNVFFMTADQLVRSDTDTQLDVYDARICEPASPCISEPPPLPAPCDGENCHGIPAATPSLPTPGSASFNGEGNAAQSPAKSVVKSLTRAQQLATALAACHKDNKKAKRAGCEKQARKNYGAAKKKAKAKRSSTVHARPEASR